MSQENNNPFVLNNHNIDEDEGEGDVDLSNVFHNLDLLYNKLTKEQVELTPSLFWLLISIEIPLTETKYNNAIRQATSDYIGKPGGARGWGILHYRLSPSLYTKTNASQSIMDWRATEAVYLHYLNYQINFLGNVVEKPEIPVSENHNRLLDLYHKSHTLLAEKYSKILQFAFSKPEFMKFLESDQVELANIDAINPFTREKVLLRNVVRSFPNYYRGFSRQPTYLYHYKKMNFLLKTIADCNYLAFDILLNKLDMNNPKHAKLLFGYITLYSNTDNNNKSNIRSKFNDLNLDSVDLSKPFTTTEYSARRERKVEHSAITESFSNENSPFNINTIDRVMRGRFEPSTNNLKDPRNLLIDVRERSGIRERQNNKEGYQSLRPGQREFITPFENDGYKWKREWLFQHTFAGEKGRWSDGGKDPKQIGKIQKGLDKKYILTFLLQHAYETNDRRLFENYSFFVYNYSKEGEWNGPDEDPSFYCHPWGREVLDIKREKMKIKPQEFVNETMLHLGIKSACERYLENYNQKLIQIAQKYLSKLNLSKQVISKTLGSNNKTDRQQLNQASKMIEDATNFFLASIDKKALEKGTVGGFQNGLSNTTTSFMAQSQDYQSVPKRAWLWWKSNIITLNDRAQKTEKSANFHDITAERRKLIGTPGFSGFYGTITLFGEIFDLRKIYNYFTGDKRYQTPHTYQSMINILIFKHTLNAVFMKEYQKQNLTQNLLLLDKQLIMKDKKKKMRLDSNQKSLQEKKEKAMESVLSNADLVKKIGNFGGKRRKKTKSKYNKKVNKKTLKKRNLKKYKANTKKNSNNSLHKIKKRNKTKKH